MKWTNQNMVIHNQCDNSKLILVQIKNRHGENLGTGDSVMMLEINDTTGMNYRIFYC